MNRTGLGFREDNQLQLMMTTMSKQLPKRPSYNYSVLIFPGSEMISVLLLIEI